MDLIEVLLVEDDEDDYVIFSDLLRTGRQSYNVTWATSPAEALVALQNHTYSLAFVDYQLGGETGIDLIRALQGGETLPPLVLLTGMDDQSVDDRAAEAGAADYLSKTSLTTAALERTIRYVLVREEAVRAARLSEAQFRTVIEEASDAIVVVQQVPDLRLLQWNRSAAVMFDFDPAGANEERFLDRVQGQAAFVQHHERMPAVIRSGPAGTIDVDVAAATWKTGDRSQTCYIIRDVSERVEFERVLHERATRDQLTGLANRSVLIERLELALAAGWAVSILYIDLDGFKSVNDHFGHGVGDELLRQAADRITGVLRPTDLVARMGGDEFAVLVAGAKPASDQMAARCLESLRRPYLIDERTCHVGASVGIAHHGDTTSADSLLQNADLAMYTAKRRGKDQSATYAPALRDSSQLDLEITEELRSGCFATNFEVHYQTIHDLETGGVVGAEALIRYRHPRLGFISPDRLIPIAEQTGLIVSLGDWVLNEAVQQTKEWLTQGRIDPMFVVSVNVSAVQLASGGFAERVASTLSRVDLPPEMLQLEVTESSLPDPTGIRALVTAEAAGVRVAVDDFGAGFSSLSSLTSSPASVAKIDRSVIAALPDDPRMVDLVTGVIQFCRQLGLTPLAEGIETSEQLAVLQALGCPFGQGFLFARPCLEPALQADAPGLPDVPSPIL